MQGARERCRLRERFGTKAPGPFAGMTKCAAGLAALIMIVSGSWWLPGADRKEMEIAAPPRPVTARFPTKSIAETKWVFDTRRQFREAQRFAATASPRKAEGLAGMAGNGAASAASSESAVLTTKSPPVLWRWRLRCARRDAGRDVLRWAMTEADAAEWSRRNKVEIEKVPGSAHRQESSGAPTSAAPAPLRRERV